MKHGHAVGRSTSPEYNSWRSMRERCGNPNADRYPHYGGRGIRVCEKWEKDFRGFLADVGPRPSLGHFLDRIDNNGDYRPGNVKWSTRSEQQRNTARNVVIEFNGEKHCVQEWSEALGMKYLTLYARIKRGWPLEKAISSKRYHKSGVIGDFKE